MNNMAYMGQDGQTVVPKVEELLSKELGISGPITSLVEVEGGGVSGASVLRDLGASVFGGNTVPLFTIHFQLTQPRLAQLDVHMLRKGLGCVGGPLAYSAVLNKAIPGDVAMADDGKFTGDAGFAGRLNGNKDLRKKCEAFAVKKGGLAGAEIEIPRTLKVVSRDGAAQLIAVTLPKSKSMGFSASLGAHEFLELASAVESAL
ncbi:hypothetical protein [Terracidiphilus gabretensis]|uniref:hypothetical protein n=1 Tax=Terracidiphilus gabretensis TaxID=1577687 RepID=UPI00071B1242|nr:hypothetical protein [Terracidiphilus gabretensis]